jgi:integrase
VGCLSADILKKLIFGVFLKEKCPTVQKTYRPYFRKSEDHNYSTLRNSKVAFNKRKKYATSYVGRMYMIMNKVFKQAQLWELMQNNPMKGVKRPRIRYKRFQTWNRKEVSLFLQYAKNYQSYIAFWLALNTGMRLGEILGLHWSDINFEENYIDLTEALDRRTRKRSSLKSKASERHIYMSQEQMNVLFKHQSSQKDDTEIVCVSSVGTYMMHRNIRRTMEIICRQSGVKKIRFHDLRHTHATLLSKIEKNPRIVQERLGHAEVRITLDIYTHTEDSSHRQSANSFSDYLTE